VPDEINRSAHKGLAFEREVASIFRALGARVEHEVALAGNQIDIVVREETPSGSEIITAVECKAFSRPVSLDVVDAIAGLAHLLKQRGLVHRAAVVAAQGFTRAARDAGRSHGIELLEIDDLRQRVSGKAVELSNALREVEEEERQQSFRPKPTRIFVAMPFTRALNDVYLLGVREVAERLGCVVERADEVEHNGYIVSVIQERVRTSDILVADTTARNPNVFYEVGYAHALGKSTILICQEGEDIPFDIKAVNHIIYGSIVELREKLERRLRSMLRLDAEQGGG
jgi:nucleoside 2-deoxyribosyltransferase